MFTRKYEYKFPIPKEHLKYRLVGHHVTIRNREFELLEEDQDLSIVPNIEEAEKPGTPMPVTQVELLGEGNKTHVVLTSKMRAIDSGGTLVTLLFCIFFLATSLVLLFIGKEPVVTITLGSISLLVLIIFLIRLQMGYFDYVRKIRTHVKTAGDQITTDVRRQLFKHKLN